MVMTLFIPVSLLPNSSEGLGVAGGQGGRFFHRQLSSGCVIMTLDAVWADAWSCQAPTAAIHVAEKSLFLRNQTSLTRQWVPGLRQLGQAPEGSLQEFLHRKGCVPELIADGLNQ
jgi:hypothetical protein